MNGTMKSSTASWLFISFTSPSIFKAAAGGIRGAAAGGACIPLALEGSFASGSW